jgi:hypothetical protein
MAKTNEDILSVVKINLVIKKIQNYGNKWIHHFRLMDGDSLPHLVMKYQPYGRRNQRRHSVGFWTVNGTGTGHET